VGDGTWTLVLRIPGMRERVDSMIMNCVRGIKAKIGLVVLASCAVCVQWRNRATLELSL
jgi:hypothetical protein